MADVVHVPQEIPNEYAVYFNFVVDAEDRDRLMAFLSEKGVEKKDGKRHHSNDSANPMKSILQEVALNVE